MKRKKGGGLDAPGKRARTQGVDAGVLPSDLPFTVPDDILQKINKKRERFLKVLEEKIDALFEGIQPSASLLSEASFPWSGKTVKQVITQKDYIAPIAEGRKTLEVRFKNQLSKGLQVDDILKLYNGVLYPFYEDKDYCFAKVAAITPYPSIEAMIAAFQENDQIKDALPDTPTLAGAQAVYGGKIKGGKAKEVLVFSLELMPESAVLPYADHDACYHAIRAKDQAIRFAYCAALHAKQLSFAAKKEEKATLKTRVDGLCEKAASLAENAKNVTGLFNAGNVSDAKVQAKIIVSEAEGVVDASRTLKKAVDARAASLVSDMKRLAQKFGEAAHIPWMEQARDQLGKGEKLSPQKKHSSTQLRNIFQKRAKLFLSLIALDKALKARDKETAAEAGGASSSAFVPVSPSMPLEGGGSSSVSVHAAGHGL